MKSARTWIVAIALAFAQAAGAQSAGSCDRTCLSGFVDLYLKALGARDPGSLPVTRDVKYTENTVALKLGEGLWQTVTKIEGYKLYVIDTAAGQAGFFGVILEHGTPNAFGLRLKIADRRIAEIETAISRNNPFLEMDNLKAPRPGLLETVPPSERASRAELIRAANQYFEGIEQATDKVVPFADECTRMENGVLTAGKPVAGLKPRSDGELTTCKTQFELGAFYATSVAPRRFEVIDEERGLVMGVIGFNVPATRTSIKLTDGTTKRASGWALMPFTGPLMEVFKVKNGKLHEIEAVMMPLLPYGHGTGWE
jgi:hypothetical protein